MNKNEQLQRHIADLESKNSSLQLSIDRLTVNLQRVEGEESDLKEKVSCPPFYNQMSHLLESNVKKVEMADFENDKSKLLFEPFKVHYLRIIFALIDSM